MIEKDLKLHWDTVYKKSVTQKLGWFEEYPEQSLRLIEKCKLRKSASLLNVGAGATTLIDELIKIGYRNIIANDISTSALKSLKNRLGNQSLKINWIIDDLTNPSELNKLEKIDLWHDRAVLHFFTNKRDQNTYFDLLKKLVKPKGFVIIATFNLKGATKCSGLPVHRYDENMLQSKLGNDFELIEAFDYTYNMPSGDKREYVYTLFQRE
jgi:SAM-dependent methyltransferase